MMLGPFQLHQKPKQSGVGYNPLFLKELSDLPGAYPLLNAHNLAQGVLPGAEGLVAPDKKDGQGSAAKDHGQEQKTDHAAFGPF
jgi:hypothetical protein